MRSAALRATATTATTAAANDLNPARPRDLLRFITCGSVDDGKSTLIGRLLADTGSVPDDVLDALRADSARLGKLEGRIDYALLVDGLSAEREQGITIDVAYRYFATPRRSFIVADTPGHEQYTRNMATGASGAELAVVLVDAEKGLLAQTRRHSFIVSLVGVRHVILAVNKMDRVGWNEAVFRRIEAEYRAAVTALGFTLVTAIPLSARDGDNVAGHSRHAPWHQGPTLIEALEAAETDAGAPSARDEFVLPVQRVNRPGADFRGFSGTVANGILRPGDPVRALPSGRTARVQRIVTFEGDLKEARAGQAVTVTLDSEIDVSRGDVLASPAAAGGLRVTSEIEARLLVTAGRPVAAGDAFLLRLGTATVNAAVAEVRKRIDIDTLSPVSGDELPLNAIGTVRLRIHQPLAVAPYDRLRELGSLILIDRLTNETVALGVVTAPAPSAGEQAVGTAAAAALLRWFEPVERRALWPALTWRAGSAAILASAVYAATGHGLAALLAGLADATGRPVLRRLHGAAWRRFDRGRPEGLLHDGGGI